MTEPEANRLDHSGSFSWPIAVDEDKREWREKDVRFFYIGPDQAGPGNSRERRGERGIRDSVSLSISGRFWERPIGTVRRSVPWNLGRPLPSDMTAACATIPQWSLSEYGPLQYLNTYRYTLTEVAYEPNDFVPTRTGGGGRTAGEQATVDLNRFSDVLDLNRFLCPRVGDGEID
ncbi:hypothetical protein U1Q18_039914 [Sarracenia purpurea var. burkii]